MTVRRSILLLLLALLGALAVRLALTSPLGHDDVEHLHTAWLISQGHRPFLDFFQKQSPLFWMLLQPATFLGGNDLLAFALLGRLTMLLGLLATVLGVLALGRLVARSSASAWAAPLLLLASPTLLYNLVAIRPDGLMAAALVWAVVLLARKSSAALLGAGFLLGLASTLLLKAVPSAILMTLCASLVAAQAAPTGDGSSGNRPDARRGLPAAWKTLGLLAAGGLLAVAPFLLWLHLAGLLEGFWFTNVTFNGWLYASPLAEDVPRSSRLATILLAMLRNEPWLPLVTVSSFLLLRSFVKRPRTGDRRFISLRGGATGRTLFLLLVLSATNLLLLVPNHLPFYSYFLLPLLSGVALSPALLERLLDRFEHHRLEWRTPGTVRGLAIPALLTVLLAGTIAGFGLAGYQRFASSEGQIRKLADLPRDRDAYDLPDHPVFLVDRHYVWDNVDRYLDTLRRMDRSGALPDWVRERCVDQLHPVPPGR